MKTILQNKNILLEISNFGAEINRLLFKNKEIFYQKDPNFWQRQSPVLFPIVGKLKNDEYFYKNEKYKITQHGFARDMNFEVIEKSDNFVKFLLKSNEETKEKFPFDFELFISYEIGENFIKTFYEVKNPGNSEIYFSIGGHPAFGIEENIEKYFIKFDKNFENKEIFRLNNGLLDKNLTENFSGNKLELSEKIFEKDALIFENIDYISLYKEDKKFLI